jgi:hypothetical protein
VFETLISTLHLMLSVVGTAPTAQLGAAGIAVAVLALVVVALVASGVAEAAGSTRPHPRRAIDVSSPLTQSDPDAAGHPRPRAPGSAAPAA